MIEKEQIKEVITEFLQGSEQFLVDIKLSTSKMAVYIDKPTGITLEECTALSRHLHDIYDPIDFFETHELEVSSPGMDSSLLVPQQYLRRIGRELKVVDVDGITRTGKLVDANDTEIKLLETVSRKENKKKIISEVLHNIEYSNIRDAKLVLNFKFK
jgi:ribosome maturation factor RimP